MSQTQQPSQPSGKPPLVRLSTWVNVVLVLILFVSCAGGDTADEVVNRLQNDTTSGGTGGMATSSEVEDLCRLMGALAAKQGVPLTVMDTQETTRCHEVAQEAAAAGTP
jgi:hypothetical protein